jgi:predicted phage gp36 major capsid-like protein
MATLTREEQKAKTAAEAAAFSARKKTASGLTFSQQLAANAQRMAAQTEAARASIGGMVRITEDGKLLSEIAYENPLAIGDAVHTEINRQSQAASKHNKATPAARYTRRVRFEIEVLVK